MRKLRSALIAAVVASAVLLPLSVETTGARFTAQRATEDNVLTAGTLSAPTGTTSSYNSSNNTLTLSWTRGAGGIAPGGYNIYRADTQGGPYALLTSVSGASTTTWAQQNPPSGTKFYVVKAYRATNWLSGDGNESPGSVP